MPSPVVNVDLQSRIVRVECGVDRKGFRIIPTSANTIRIRREDSLSSEATWIATRAIHGHEIQISGASTKRVNTLTIVAGAWFEAVDAAPRAEPKWHITAHAVDRYRQRFSPNTSIDEARVELETFSIYAIAIGMTRTGDILHASEGVQIGFVVSDDRKMGLPTLLTVIDLYVAMGHLLRKFDSALALGIK